MEERRRAGIPADAGTGHVDITGRGAARADGAVWDGQYGAPNGYCGVAGTGGTCSVPYALGVSPEEAMLISTRRRRASFITGCEPRRAPPLAWRARSPVPGPRMQPRDMAATMRQRPDGPRSTSE